jgi:hypothetical protein
MKIFSTLALLCVMAQCSDAHQMLRSASTKSVDFSVLSESGSGAVGSKMQKAHDGSFDGKKPDGSWGGHHPHHPRGSFNGKMAGSFDGSWAGEHHKGRHHPAGSFDGSFGGHHEWAGSFDGSFKGHGKDVPFPGKGKGKKKASSTDGSETQQETTDSSSE